MKQGFFVNKGAWVILTVIVFPILAAAGNKILDHSERIVKVEVVQESQMEILKEIRCDIKSIKGEPCR